jgi:hypothetical protein
MRRAVAAALTAALLLAACASASQVEDLDARVAELEAQVIDLEQAAIDTTRNISGTLATPAVGSGCSIAIGVFVDDGELVTIYDGSDTTLAIDRLGDHTVTDETCIFEFILHDVPTDRTFYRVQVGEFLWELDRSTLEAANWTLDLDSQ